MPRTCVRRTDVLAARSVALLAVSAVLLTACSGSSSSSPTSPTPSVLTVTAITPTSGATTGGTEVTITGTNFSSGALVTIGGVAATNIRVVSSTSIQATSPAHAAGSGDVVVMQGTQTATLPAAFSFVAVPTVTAVTPTSGSTSGGTDITITGTGFAAGATVTVGGVAATNVRVSSATTILAVTGAHAAGASDVTVTVAGQTARLAAAFTYVVPPPNPPPVIRALTAQGTKPNEPSQFADLGEEIVLSVTVEDAETPVDRLQFEWSAPSGAFTGSGATVRWRAPASFGTPGQIRIDVKVTEVVETASDSEVRGAISQSVSASTTVRVHNSLEEVKDYSVQFLLDFSNSDLAPAYVVRNFWDGCPGKASELEDVANNRLYYQIFRYNIGVPVSATLNFKGTCPFRNKTGDACVSTPVEWQSTDRRTGRTETATGFDQTTAVYRESRWWLCDSDFNGRVTNPFAAVPFIR